MSQALLAGLSVLRSRHVCRARDHLTECDRRPAEGDEDAMAGPHQSQERILPSRCATLPQVSLARPWADADLLPAGLFGPCRAMATH